MNDAPTVKLYPPQRIGAAHWDACASAPNMTGAAPNAIGATAQSKVHPECRPIFELRPWEYVIS